MCHKVNWMIPAASVIVLVLFGTSSQTSAEIVNGGFEMPFDPVSGPPGWTVSISTAGVGTALVDQGSTTSERLQCANLWAEARADGFARPNNSSASGRIDANFFGNCGTVCYRSTIMCLLVTRRALGLEPARRI